MPVCVYVGLLLSLHVSILIHLWASVKIMPSSKCCFYIVCASSYISVGCCWPMFISVFVCGWLSMSHSINAE